jgi:histidyl-tRNA synthetase
MVTQGYKGTRDFYPEDKRLQKWMFSKIRSAVEKYGYEEYDAPVIESTEIYNLKGSAEIVNEQSYSFVDRGGRSVTLRTEMTPSVSRMVAARRQHLIYPALHA